MSTAFAVYSHTLFDGRKYIGITSQKPETRWQNGKLYHHNKYLTSAIKKYGWDAFKHEILYSNCSKECACEIEKELIWLYETTNRLKGFNQSLGGEASGYGYKHDPEELRRSHGKRIGSHLSDETKAKISRAMKGKTSNRKGVVLSMEQREKISLGNKKAWERRKNVCR